MFEPNAFCQVLSMYLHYKEVIILYGTAANKITWGMNSSSFVECFFTSITMCARACVTRAFSISAWETVVSSLPMVAAFWVTRGMEDRHHRRGDTKACMAGTNRRRHRVFELPSSTGCLDTA